MKHTAQSARYGWVVVAVSCAIIALGSASLYITVVALKPIALENGWSRAMTAGAYSAAMLGAGIGGILMGRLTDRFGIARPVAVGIVLLCLGCAVVSYTTTLWQFLLVHLLLIGLLGNAALYGPLVANASLWFTRNRGIAVGLVASGQGLAGGLWSPVFRYTVETYGWRETYFYYGLFLAAVLLPLCLALRSPARSEPANRSSSPGSSGLAPGESTVAGRGTLVVLSAAIIGCCIAMSIPVVHMVAHVSDLGFGLTTGARILSVALLCAIVSRIAWGSISDRIGGLTTLLITSTGQALALVALIFADTALTLYLTAAFFGLGYGGIVPAYAVFMREIYPVAGTATRMGLIIAFGTVGMATGAWLGGWAFDVYNSYRAAFILGAACNCVNLVLIGTLFLRRRRPRALVLASA